MFRLNEKRKTQYTSSAIQGRIIWRVFCYWIIYHLFLFHLLFVTSTMVVGGYDGATMSGAYGSFLQGNAMLIACALVTLPLILRDMLQLTNRVAGPFVQFEKALKAMKNGEVVEKVQIRKGDLVDQFVVVFNDFVQYHNAELKRRAAETQAKSASEESPSLVSPNVPVSLALPITTLPASPVSSL